MSYLRRQFDIFLETMRLYKLFPWTNGSTISVLKTLFISVFCVIVFYFAFSDNIEFPYLLIAYFFAILGPPYYALSKPILSVTRGDVIFAEFIKLHTSGYPRIYASYEFRPVVDDITMPERLFFLEYYNPKTKFIENRRYAISKHPLHKNFVMPLTFPHVIDCCADADRLQILLKIARENTVEGNLS